MPQYISYFDLGATLYTPCTHGKLSSILQSGSPFTRSIALCLEDSVKEIELSSALDNLKRSLEELTPTNRIKRFIRPRNHQILKEILSYKNIGMVDGFILPKFDLNTIGLYKKVIQEDSHHNFSYMPILETEQVFDSAALIQLRQRLKDWGDSIICLRIGGNDLMNILGIKRMPGMTTYDTPLRSTLDQLVIKFRPEGFELSAPVFDIIDDLETLKKEMAMDLAYGFFAKTAIHPSQIETIESALAGFSHSHNRQADLVLRDDASAVFRFNGQMMEQACHKSWATRTLQLADSILIAQKTG